MIYLILIFILLFVAGIYGSLVELKQQVRGDQNRFDALIKLYDNLIKEMEEHK